MIDNRLNFIGLKIRSNDDYFQLGIKNKETWLPDRFSHIGEHHKYPAVNALRYCARYFDHEMA